MQRRSTAVRVPPAKKSTSNQCKENNYEKNINCGRTTYRLRDIFAYRGGKSKLSPTIF